jgi:Fic family protein
MSARIRDEREAYYDVLEATQKDGLDITPWLDWFLACLGKAIDLADVTLTAVVAKARFWERNAGQAFNDRQRHVLNRLLDGGFVGKLTSSKWAKLTESSQDTALRDITDLIEKQVLSKDPAGGRSTGYSLTGIQRSPNQDGDDPP